MLTCDYCPSGAAWYATAESATAGLTRLACQGHVDRARRDCSAAGTPTVTEVVERPWSQLLDGGAL